jgi:hypothetical protein
MSKFLVELANESADRSLLGTGYFLSNGRIIFTNGFTSLLILTALDYKPR